MVKGDLETMTIGSTSTARTNTVCLRNAKNSATETNNGVNIADISVECPLCMENLDIDDLDFFPCSCGYQVCRFCWHRLKNDDNGLCPACRQPYPDSPIHFSSISIERVEELKKMKKKQKEKQKLKDANKQQNLSTIRVVQKNLLFVIGIPSRFSQEELRKEFSRYGKIVKMVINANSAYVTYTRAEDAVLAIRTLNESSQNSNNSGANKSIKLNNNHSINSGSILTSVKASLGTTKYCTHWLRCQTCPKQPDCMYLHELADQEASFTKEEMQAGKHTEYEKRLILHFLEVIANEKERQQNMNVIPNSESTNIKLISTQQQRPHNFSSGENQKTTDDKTMSSCDYDFSQFDAQQSYPKNDQNDFLNCGNLNNSKTATLSEQHRWLSNSEITSKNSNSRLSSTSVLADSNGNSNESLSTSANNCHSSDSSSGNSSLSSTPNHHFVGSSIFSKYSSSSSGTSSLSCDESNTSGSNSSSSTPDNIQQQQQQQQELVNSEGLILLKSNRELCPQDSMDVNKMNHYGDDDDLDFDPISLSHRALEDMLRSSAISSSTNDINPFENNHYFNQHNLVMQRRENTVFNQNHNIRIHQSNVNENTNVNVSSTPQSTSCDFSDQQSPLLNRYSMINLSAENLPKIVPSADLQQRQQYQMMNENILNNGFHSRSPLSINQQIFNSGNQNAMMNQNFNFLSMVQKSSTIDLVKPNNLMEAKQNMNESNSLVGNTFNCHQPAPTSMFGSQEYDSLTRLQQWQQQQNSLRQLLPNVNIKFQQNELNLNGSNNFRVNGNISPTSLNQSSRSMNQLWHSKNNQSQSNNQTNPSQQHQIQSRQQKIQLYLQQQQQQRNNLNQYIFSQMMSNQQSHSVRQQPPPPGFNNATRI